MMSHDPSAGAPGGLPAAARGRRSPKIRDRHLDLLAVIYIRQSSPQQVLDHKESRERQYELVGQALALGWPADRVLVIDDDQGRSAREPDRRRGFQRLLAEVTMDHVGLVLGLEMSRLSRTSRSGTTCSRSAPSSGRSWPIRTASMTPTTPTTGSCSA
ncbi:recombinase family protein [Singulisphaera sp. PoT]|uniref:recombinase family protein n=1 Tax=Singulisphaera sp. PoT TaxID=3411797 RepID=UPI003BF53FB7